MTRDHHYSPIWSSFVGLNALCAPPAAPSLPPAPGDSLLSPQFRPFQDVGITQRAARRTGFFHLGISNKCAFPRLDSRALLAEQLGSPVHKKPWRAAAWPQGPRLLSGPPRCWSSFPLVAAEAAWSLGSRARTAAEAEGGGGGCCQPRPSALCRTTRGFPGTPAGTVHLRLLGQMGSHGHLWRVKGKVNPGSPQLRVGV